MRSLLHWHFGTKVPREGIPIAHIRTPELLSSNAVAVVDYSDQIPQNTFFEKEIRISLDQGHLTYYVDKKSFLITDKFNGTKPLYYKHVIQQDIYIDAEGQSDIVVENSAGETQSEAFFSFECGKRVIYHSFPHGEVFFVVYPRVDDSNNIVERQYRELLQSKPAFEEANSDHIDDNGCIKADADAYLIEERDGQPHFWRLTLPRPTDYALQYTLGGLFTISVPGLPQNEPWYIDINNTVLLTTQVAEDYLLRYSIPEFMTQNFYPFPPIRMVAERTATPVAPRVIDVGATRIKVSNKTPIDIKIYAPDGTLSQAITTDENKLGKTVNNVSWEVGLIQSTDTFSGRISLRRDIRPGEIAKVNFYHETTAYRYIGYNFNPLYNPDALTQKVAILCRPNGSGCGPAISHVVLDSSNTVLSASNTEISAWISGSETFDDLVETWVYLPGVSTGNQRNFMLLGLVSTAIPIAPEHAAITDARRRGGGVQEHLITNALRVAPGASQNWDIGFWDGPREPVQGAILLYLPTYIQNVFTEDEIRARASKFAPAGSHFVIRYY